MDRVQNGTVGITKRYRILEVLLSLQGCKSQTQHKTMAFIKADFPDEVKKQFQQFCKEREEKEAQVVRKAVKNYMSQCQRTVTLTVKKAF